MHPTDPSALDGTNGFRIAGLDPNDLAGTSVSDAGDVNGDGLDDFIVGAAGGNEAFLIFGRESGFAADFDLSALDGEDGVRLAGVTSSAGYDVRAAGDINGDSFDDIIISERGSYLGHVVFGADGGFGASLNLADLDGADGFTIDASAFGRLAGYAVGGAGDINGDGFKDIVIGSPEADPYDSGAAHIIFGGPGDFSATIDLAALDASQGFQVTSVAADDQTGFSLDSLGDVNGDGVDDLLIGAQRADAGAGFNAGAGYVIFGVIDGFQTDVNLADLDGADGFRMEGSTGNDLIGRAVAGVGDVNGDGLNDFLIASGFAGSSGEAYLVFGSDASFAATLDLGALDGTDGMQIVGADSGDNAGFDISGVGDVNGDGFADFAISAPFAASRNGEAYVFFGKAGGFDASFDLSNFDSADGFRIDGATASGQLGIGIGGGGDIDGDGLDDLIVGARAANSFRGEANVFFGFDSGAITHQGNSARNIITGDDDDNVMVLGQGSDDFSAGGGDDVVRGGAGRDVGTLGSGNDRAWGGTEKDTLNGGNGDDILYGDDGNDTLILGGGADTVFGGDGDDKIFERAENLGVGDKIIGGEGNRDQLFIQSSGVLDLTLLDTFTGVERVKVASNQVVVSVDQDLIWSGRSANEIFTLGDGEDKAKAGNGDDVVDGGAGDDRLIGHAGDDVLIGGAGNDRISGKSGADTFVYGLSDGRDKIFDFEKGIDIIDIQEFGFDNFFLDVLPLMSDIGSKAVIEFNDQDRIVLVGISSADLGAADFNLGVLT